MSSRGPKKPDRGSPTKREPASDDTELWRRVAETVTPLKGRKTPRREDIAVPPVKPPRVASKPAPKKPATSAASLSSVKQAASRPTPPLAGIDRKLTRRIGRGHRPVDAKIDLHGLTQNEAHQRLLSFLQGARARGHRVVLVVTGKGRDTGAADWWEEGTRGVLRRAVPEWLATPPFRLLVVGYEQAHVSKGGEGAIYVQLRRKERPERKTGPEREK